MPSPFAYDVARLKAEVLRRVRAGESLCAICRDAGMPARITIYKWAGADAAWATALAAARWRGRNEAAAAARRRPFDQRLADRLIVALDRDGGRRSLEAILAADPELPCKPVLRRWRRQDPVFDRVLRALLAHQRRVRGRAPVPQAVSEAVGERLAMGESFADLGRDADMPSRQTLRRWYARDPAFAAVVDDACDFRDWMMGDRIAARQAALIGPGVTLRDLQAATAEVSRQRARLRHRPGTAHRRAGQCDAMDLDA